MGNPSWDQSALYLPNRPSCRSLGFLGGGGGGTWRPQTDLSFGGVAAHLDSREVRWSAVVGSGLIGGEVTKAAALAQFLLQ